MLWPARDLQVGTAYSPGSVILWNDLVTLVAPALLDVVLSCPQCPGMKPVAFADHANEVVDMPAELFRSNFSTIRSASVVVCCCHIRMLAQSVDSVVVCIEICSAGRWLRLLLAVNTAM